MSKVRNKGTIGCFEDVEESLYFVPCGHGPFCPSCVKKSTGKTCGFCKKVVESGIKIYPL